MNHQAVDPAAVLDAPHAAPVDDVARALEVDPAIASIALVPAVLAEVVPSLRRTLWVA